MKYKNSLKKGSVRYIIFKEDEVWYGTCLEFNIVESGDTPQEAMLLLFEAIQGYLESAKKIKARPNILNQKPDPEYEKMWDELKEQKEQREETGSVFSFGQMLISQALRSYPVPM
jgi:predicted RNase H-like HicB family nuclease